MYQISELAKSGGLPFAALRCCEKLGLLTGKRPANGYRVDTDVDRQRLQLMQQLQAGGLSLRNAARTLMASTTPSCRASGARRWSAEIASYHACDRIVCFEVFVPQKPRAPARSEMTATV